jgi:predicted unusual protein kinase regulating ubiquinone biosynthesis (AarF/ABC1/UbiB family)
MLDSVREATQVAATAATRSARLASIPAYSAALGVEGLVRRRVLGQDADAVRSDLRQRSARRTQETLGAMKGGALKTGQLLSTVEMLFPPDPEGAWRTALTGLQESNPAVPFAELEPVLRDGLGDDWRTLLPELDEEATAAASIGQVHRGVWHDGRDVAVKIQYPGIAAALAADLRAVSWATRAAAIVARGMAMPPLIAELRTRLVEELDYVHEGVVQQSFADAYRDDPQVVVPEVRFASERVLVSDWLGGTPLVRLGDDLSPATAARRNASGELYQRFLLSGPSRAGRLHTDPHPGNFRIMEDGRLGVMDFGSSLHLPGGMPSAFGRLMRVMLDPDPERVLAGLRAEGFVRPDRTVDARKLVDYLAPFSEPARHARFTFTREWLQREFSRVNDPRNPEFAVALQLEIPADLLFTHRVWLGVIGVLSQLGATVPVRPELERWLPGFATP